jgi:hypothetical protein
MDSETYDEVMKRRAREDVKKDKSDKSDKEIQNNQKAMLKLIEKQDMMLDKLKGLNSALERVDSH